MERGESQRSCRPQRSGITACHEEVSESRESRAQVAEAFESGVLAGFRNDLDLVSSTLKDVSGARSLPRQEMQTKFKGLLTKTNGLAGRLESFSEQAELHRSDFEGCGQITKEAGDLIRKGLVAAGAEMIRK